MNATGMLNKHQDKPELISVAMANKGSAKHNLTDKDSNRQKFNEKQ